MIFDGIEQAWPGTNEEWHAFLWQRCRCGHPRIDHVGHIHVVTLYGVLEPVPWGETCRTILQSGQWCDCKDFAPE
jgi:hypothetical protein